MGIGYGLRYSSKDMKYFCTYSEAKNNFLTGTIFKLDNETSLGTTLEFSGQDFKSNAAIGYMRKTEG